MTDETKSREEWHVEHHGKGFRQIFNTEQEARAVAESGDTVTKVVKNAPVPYEYDPENDEDLQDPISPAGH